MQVSIQPGLPYHVTARSIHRERFPIPLAEVWKIMEDQLYFISHAFRVDVHAFVLMGNHFHLLVSAPEENLSAAMGWFMRETAREINRRSARTNQLWGGRYFRSAIRSPLYYLHAYKYLYRNPVAANLVERTIDYPFSTLRGLLGLDPLTVPIVDNTIFDMGTESCLEWLDRSVSDEDWQKVRKALKKQAFCLAKPKKSHQIEALEINML